MKSHAGFCIEDHIPPAFEVVKIKPRRILILDTSKDGTDRANLLTGVAANPSLEKAFAWSGLSAQERMGEVAYRNRHHDAFIKFRLPRDVPWSTLPMICKPYYAVVEDVYDGGFSGKEKIDQGLLNSIEHIVLNPNKTKNGRSALLDIAGILLHLVGRNIPCYIAEEPGVMTPLAITEIGDPQNNFGPSSRMIYNWHWNIKALMPRIMSAAYDTRRPPRQGIQSHTVGPEWERSAINAIARSPFALQILFRVASEHPRPLTYDLARPIPYSSDILVGGGFSRKAGSPMLTVDWTGHGVPSVTFDQAGETFQFCRLMSGALSDLNSSALLVADKDRNARLSPAGAQLLKLLPPGCRDLGMVTRWITPEGRLGSDKDIPAMDRWLTTVLRHIKKAANELEMDGTPHGR